MINIKNKKASGTFLGEHVYNLIIAVICLVLLFFMGKAIISLFYGNAELKQATGTLNEISDRIDLLSEGQTGKYTIFGPKDWRMIPYDKQLCICPESPDSTKQKEVCLSKGVCKSFNFEIRLTGISTVCAYPAGIIGKKDDLANCFLFSPITKGLYLKKQDNIIELSSDEPIPSSNSLNSQMYNFATGKFEPISLNFRKSQYFTTMDLYPYLQLNSVHAQSKDPNQATYFFYLKPQEDNIEIYFHERFATYPIGKIESDGYIWLGLKYLEGYYDRAKDNSGGFIIQNIQRLGDTELQIDSLSKYWWGTEKVKISPTNIYLDYNELKKLIETT